MAQKVQKLPHGAHHHHTRAADGAELPSDSSIADESAVLEFRGAEIDKEPHLQFRRCEITKDLCVVCRARAGACLNLVHIARQLTAERYSARCELNLKRVLVKTSTKPVPSTRCTSSAAPMMA